MLQSATSCVNYICKRFIHQSSTLLRKNKKCSFVPFVYPYGNPVPPEHPTCTYIPLPEHLDPQKWNYFLTDKPGSRMRRHLTYHMQRDARFRATAEFYGPLRFRMNCLVDNKILPKELRDLSTEERDRLPRASYREKTHKYCVITSRFRGSRKRWRMSRIMFRKIADHGKMSGIERAYWSGGTQGHYVDLSIQRKKKKH